MKNLNLSSAMLFVALLSVFQSNAVYSVEQMSESDMGNVSAESGDVLNIMGASAAGQSDAGQSGDHEEKRKNKGGQALASVNYIEVDQSLHPRENTSLTPSSVNPKDSISTFKISERSDGQLGTSTIYYDEKNNHTTSSYKDNTLTINQNVQVHQIQLNQMRHSESGIPRGNYSIGEIQVSGAVSISNR